MMKNCWLLTFSMLIVLTMSMCSAAYGYNVVYLHDDSQVKITDDPTGGDCPSIGQWDPETKTCTMDRDIYGLWGVWLSGPGLTLDGNGHTIAGEGGLRRGIDVLYSDNATIKNVVVTGYGAGIAVGYSTGVKIIDNLIIDNSRPDSTWNNSSGILIYGETNHLISGNTIQNNGYGIWLAFTSGKTTIVNNNFIDNLSDVNDANAYIQGVQNTYNLDLPTGGNYWSRYDSEIEGCFDDDGDGICDAPFTVYLRNNYTGLYDYYQGVVDYHPWKSPVEGNSLITVPDVTPNEPDVITEEPDLPPEETEVPPEKPCKSDYTIEAFAELIKKMVAEKSIADKGIAISLIKSMENAEAAVKRGQLNAAARQVEAAINKIEAQSGKKISADAAEELLDLAGKVVHNL